MFLKQLLIENVCAKCLQGFRWAIDNDEFQGRVETIKPLFEGKIMLNEFLKFLSCLPVFLSLLLLLPVLHFGLYNTIGISIHINPVNLYVFIL